MLSTLPVEELCRKLKPVFGKKIDQLYMKYTLADSLEQRIEIEQMLNLLYQKYLNESLLSEKVLLEPPRQEDMTGEFPLGLITYAEKDLYPFCLRKGDWIRHVCISGMSGSGKTNFAFKILDNFIKRKIPFLIFDWKKSFRPLLLLNPKILLFTVGNDNVSNLFKININRPPKSVAPREWINILCDLISESFGTSYGVHKLLSEAMDQSFRDLGVYKGSNNYPTWHQIKDKLEEMEAGMKGRKGRESEWIASALRVAHVLTFGGFGASINHKEHDAYTVDELLDKEVIFELNALDNSEKKFFCQFLLMYIYKLKKANQAEEQGLKSIILVDEAHNIFLKQRTMFVSESVTDMIYREVREYGIGLICLDQHISKLSDTVAGNSACNIAFQQVLPADVETVAGIMQLKEKKKFFSMLPVGHAIVKLAERYHNPFLVKTPLMPTLGIMLKDEKIKEAMKSQVKFERSKKYFEQSCAPENIAKQIERMDKIFMASGVKADEDFLKAQLEIARRQREERQGLNSAEIFAPNSEEEFSSLRVKTKSQLSRSSITTHTDLAKQELAFLELIQKHIDLGTSQIYKALHVSIRKGNTMRDALVKRGLIQAETVRNDKGWKKVFRLLPAGERLLENVSE
jgi:DNA-binding MarR family transcriptional regulator